MSTQSASEAIIKAWVRSLLALGPLLDASAEHQIEVRLRASRGKVSMRPTVILDGGPQSLVDAKDAAAS